MKRLLLAVITPVIIISACSLFTFDNPADPMSDNFAGIVKINGIEAIEQTPDSGLITLLIGGKLYTYMPQGSFSEMGPTRTEITAVSSSSTHYLALDSDGQVWNWGPSIYSFGMDYGQFDSESPLAVPGIDIPVTFIWTGSEKWAAGTGTEVTYIWGNFSGSNTTVLYTEPTAKSWGIVKDIAFIDNEVLFVEEDGLVYRWNADMTAPETVSGLSNIEQISISTDTSSDFTHYLALDADGRVWSWGGNSYGQLGDGTTDDRTDPGLVPGLSEVLSIKAVRDQSMALTDTALYGWGLNSNGSLGRFWLSALPTPTIISADWEMEGEIPVNFFNSGWRTVVYTDAGFLYGMGYFSSVPLCGYLDGRVTDLSNFTLSNIEAVAGGSTGFGFGLLLMDDGSLQGFGDNSSGMMGNNTTNWVLELEDTSLSGFKDVAVGNGHVVALEIGGTVKAWGEGSDGQLGDGNDTDSLTPVTATGLTGITSVATGSSFSLAVKDDGTVWGWGFSSDGAIGPTSPGTPEAVSGLSGITDIAAGYAHSLFLKNDSTVWALGNNDYGQLGNGTTADSDTPVQVTGLTNVTAIAASLSISAALKSNGTVWGWGSAYDNALSQGEEFSSYSLTPYQIGDITTATAIAAGLGKILILLEDGSLLRTGSSGALTKTENIVEDGPYPLDIFEGLTITTICGGSSGFIIIDENGKAYSWLLQ